jgi:CheY-like chemotaxis protein
VGDKILLIDDSVTVQKIISLTFSDEGVDVVTVDSGDEAINRLNYLRPALVMADVSIPGRNGYDVCAYIKNRPELKHIPVILLVPGFETYDAERGRRVGADHHLTKPFQSIRALIATVKSLINGGPPVTLPPGGTGSLPKFEALELPAPPDDEENEEEELVAAESWLPELESDLEPELEPDLPELEPDLEADLAVPLAAPPPVTTVVGLTEAARAALVDEIVGRVVAEVTGQLTVEIGRILAAQTGQLAAELAGRVADEVTDRLEPLLLRLEQAPGGTPVPIYDDSDQVLELDDF